MVIHVTVHTVHTILQLVGGVPSIFYTASLITFPHSSHYSILGISTCSIGLLTTLYLNDSSPFLGLELEGPSANLQKTFRSLYQLVQARKVGKVARVKARSKNPQVISENSCRSEGRVIKLILSHSIRTKRHK